MTDDDKTPYSRMCDKDKERYERQMSEREKMGYFLLDDKSKSTDEANAKLFKEKKKRATDVESDPEDL